MDATTVKSFNNRAAAVVRAAAPFITSAKMNVAGLGCIEALELTSGRGRDARGEGSSELIAECYAMGMDATAIITGAEMNVAGVGYIEARGRAQTWVVVPSQPHGMWRRRTRTRFMGNAVPGSPTPSHRRRSALVYLRGFIDGELCRVSDHHPLGNDDELCRVSDHYPPGNDHDSPRVAPSLEREAPERATTTAEQLEDLWTTQNQRARFRGDDGRHPLLRDGTRTRTNTIPYGTEASAAG